MKIKKTYVVLIFFTLIFISLSTVMASDLNEDISQVVSETDNPSNYDMDEVSEKNIKSDNIYEPKTIGLNSTTFDTYVTNGQFNDRVSDGDTIDINGKLDGDRFALNVNKSLNFISSNNESYINVYTQSTGFYGEATGGQITFGHGSSGSNITNLYFYNSRVVFSNTSNILVNNISVIDYEANIGSGTGHFILNAGSSNITINNSYFYTKDNGAHSTVVFTGASNCIFENNTIEGVGSLGNLVYINAYNANTDDSNNGIVIRNNLINASSAGSQLTCFAICIIGSNHLIENNTVLYSGVSLSGIWGRGDYENITIKDNFFEGGVVLGNSSGVIINSMKNVTIINNTIRGLSIDSAKIINNTLNYTIITGDNVLFEGNTGKTLNISGNNNIINNNTLNNMDNYTINNMGNNNIITNNSLVCINSSSDESIINSTETNIENNRGGQRHIYITKDNYLEYGYFTTGYHYTLNSSIIKEGDYINIDGQLLEQFITNSSVILDIGFSGDLVTNITFFNMTVNKEFNFLIANSTLINCYMPGVYIKYNTNLGNIMTKLINSTIKYNVALNYSTNIDMDENSSMTLCFDNNIVSYYFNNLRIVNSTSHLFSSVTGTVSRIKYCAVNETSTIRVFTGNDIIHVDRIVYFEGMLNESTLNKNLTFIAGSSGSTVNNLLFNDYVILNESDIKFTNCTFNKGVILNNVTDIEITDCIFNTSDTPLVMIGSSDNTIQNNTFIDFTEHETNTAISLIESSGNTINNNIINTTNQYTIYADENSVNNNIIENILYASTTKDKDSTFISEENTYSDSKVIRYDTNIDIALNNDTTLSVGHQAPVTITVTDENNNLVDNGYIEIYLDGIFQNKVNLTNGTYTGNITFETPTTSTIKVRYYAEHTYYDSVANITNITVSKSTVTIVANDITGYVNDEIILTAYIVLDNDYVINEGNVWFKIGSETYKTEVVNGTASINTIIPSDWLTISKITVQYLNSTRFTGTSIKVNLNVSIPSISTKIVINDINSVMYAQTTVTAFVTDENGANMTTGRVTFTDSEGNIITESTVIDGIATATVTFNNEIESTITATYNPETTEYATSTATASLSIQKPITNIALDEITPTAGETVTLTARVTDQLSNNITGGKIVFKINGKTLKDANGKVIYAKVIDGIAQANYTIPESYADKNITIQATYSGCTKYDKQTAEITTFVTKPEATLTIDQLPDSMQANTNITVKAKVQTGTTPITTGKVIFKINGKTLKDANGKVIYANVDANGEAILSNYNLGNLKVGAYTLKAVFTASGYDRLEATDTISIIA